MECHLHDQEKEQLDVNNLSYSNFLFVFIVYH